MKGASPFAVAFGLALAREREAANLSQEELAVKASLHRTAIGQLERGERVPRCDTLVKLAGSLAIPPERLLAGFSWKPTSYVEGSFTLAP